MSDNTSVSLVIVSRDRPQELKRVLTSLRFLQYDNFEVIVVTPDDPRVHFPDTFNIDRIKFVPFDTANISAARNLGIDQASGQIVAFCDDDAVPEPSWLNHLIAPFGDQTVGATGGYVRGRNGISFQWKGRSFDRHGGHAMLEETDMDTIVHSGNAETGIKTEGTNCAFRKQALLDLGGFDENFRYYLDETDLNMRVGLAGWKTAIVPLAQVHHGFAASRQRGRNRAPKSLFDVGYSKAWFCKKYAKQQDVTSSIECFTRSQKRRLVEFMVRGELEPRDVSRLMEDLATGLKEGAKCDPLKNERLAGASEAGFKPFHEPSTPLEIVAITCRSFHWRKAFHSARAMARAGKCVSVFQFSMSSIFHRIEYHQDGFWLHRGGIFGRSDRSDPVFQLNTLKSRAKKELRRLDKVRPIAKVFSIHEVP